jgi:DNA-binding transcriptional regulator LsrR (DeoR family)
MARGPLQKLQASLVARQFYIDGISKSDIAKELGISRFKVARLIDMARAEGIVRIEIQEQRDLNTDLAEGLRQKFELREVLVLDGPDLPSASLVEPLGLLLAEFLEEKLKDGQLFGVALGRVIEAASRVVQKLNKVDVVQAAGIPPGLDLSYNPTETVSRFQRASGGKAYPLFGPMWVADPSLAEKLRQDPSISSAMSKYASLDVLVVGIGSWSPQESGLSAGFLDDWRRDALKKNVCADVCATLLDPQGNVVPSPLDEVGLCLGAEQLKTIPKRIGVGGGKEKIRAVEAVLKGKWLDTLITDATVARSLI